MSRGHNLQPHSSRQRTHLLLALKRAHLEVHLSGIAAGDCLEICQDLVAVHTPALHYFAHLRHLAWGACELEALLPCLPCLCNYRSVN